MMKLHGKIARLTKAATKHLDPGEAPQFVVMGQYETKVLGTDSIRTGVFLATDRRLVLYAAKFVGYEMEVFPYSKISSIEMSKGILGHAISFFATGNKVRMKWILKGDVTGFVTYLKERIETGPANLEAPMPDIPGQLEKLAELRDSGVLSETEFADKKRELLSRM